MQRTRFEERRLLVEAAHLRLVRRANERIEPGNGVYYRYRRPVLTAAHVPPPWRYDYDPQTNPFFQERLGVNSVFNAGAILLQGRYLLVCRVEGHDRKSFFAVAESADGISRFRFWDRPIELPESDAPATNVYDMRITAHQDGWIYGLFCAERKDPAAPPGDTSRAVAQAGIARTRDLRSWQRLPDLVTPSPQQRNVVLHPEFVGGKYLLYTRPQDGFIEVGSGGGICWGLCESLEDPRVEQETLLDARAYHTIKEQKNGGAHRRCALRAGGCTWRTECATPPPGCVTCSTRFSPTWASRGG